MQLRFITNISLIVLLGPPTVSSAQQPAMKPAAQKQSKVNREPIKSPKGETFYLAPSLESPANFNVIISDGEEHVVSGEFSIKELQIVQEILNEAKKFAFSEDAVGKGEPLTTRFSSHIVRGFAIDVSKLENQSHFFINLKTEIGFITVDGGIIKRNAKYEDGFFFDILYHVESQIPVATKQPLK